MNRRTCDVYSIIGREDGKFDICDVCNQEADKLMFRHPFINWNEEGEWRRSLIRDMYINEAGQVVYGPLRKGILGRIPQKLLWRENQAPGRKCKPKNAAVLEKT